jgi:hypothetical protein
MPAPTQPSNPPSVHGKGGVIAISATRGGAVVPIALITDWTLDRTSDKIETTSLGDANKTYVKGLDDVKGTFTGQWNSTDDTLFEAAESVDGCQMEIWPNKDSDACFAGPAWLDVSVKGGVTAAVTIDGSFSANGSWTRTPWGAVATGASPGTGNGTYTPAGASAPANFTALQSSGLTASPATAWTSGQYIVLGDGSKAHWNATAWTAGAAP